MYLMKIMRNRLVLGLIAVLALLLSACTPTGQTKASTPADIPSAYVQALRVASVMGAEDGRVQVVDPKVLASIVLNDNLGKWPVDPDTYTNSNGAAGAFQFLPQICARSKSIVFADAAKCATKYLADAGFSGRLSLGNPDKPAPGTVVGALTVYKAGRGYLNQLQADPNADLIPSVQKYIQSGMAYYKQITEAYIFIDDVANVPAFEPPVASTITPIPAYYREKIQASAEKFDQDARILGGIVWNERPEQWPPDPTVIRPGLGSQGAFGLMPQTCKPADAVIFAKAADCTARFLRGHGFSASMPVGDYLKPRSGTIAGAFAVYNAGTNALQPYFFAQETRDYTYLGIAYVKQLSAPNMLGKS